MQLEPVLAPLTPRVRVKPCEALNAGHGNSDALTLYAAAWQRARCPWLHGSESAFPTYGRD